MGDLGAGKNTNFTDLKKLRGLSANAHKVLW
jgi:hypothetical protein